MSRTEFVAPQHPPSAEVVRYQDHLGSPSRSEKTIQRILSQSTRVHVLRDKLDAALAKDLELRVQRLGAQVISTPDAANVVVTVLKAPKRIAKHFGDADVNVSPFQTGDREGEQGETGAEGEVDRRLGEGVGRDWRRFVVTPDWVGAVERVGTLVDPDLYPAVVLKTSNDTTDREEGKDDSMITTTNVGEKRKRSPSDSPLLPTRHDSKHPWRPSVKRSLSSSSSSSYPFPTAPSASSSSQPSNSQPQPKRKTPIGYYDPIQPPPSCPRWQNTRFSCRRPSPLVSPNQLLVAELELIRTERRLTGDTYSEMAYMRAISALKAYPFRIPDPYLEPPDIFDRQLMEMRLGEVEKLKGVGKKIFSFVKQYFSHPPPSEGSDEEERRRRRVEEPRIVEAKAIKRDRAVFVMNAFTELYGIGPIGARDAYNSGARSFGDVLNRGKSLATHLSARESVRILADLRKPIGRQECQAVTADIMTLVRSVLGGGVEVKHEICGGYRLGKERTYDLDVIIGHDDSASRALHMRLLDQMKRKGLITHIVNISTPAPSESDRANQALHIDIANIVVLPPLTPSNPHPVHRRVDLVFCPLRIYGATVLG